MTDRPDTEYSSKSVAARFPPNGGQWPAELPEDMAAAYLGWEKTGELRAAVQRGEAPRPSATRLRKKNGVTRRVPVWAKAAIDAFVANHHEIRSDVSAAAKEDIGALL